MAYHERSNLDGRDFDEPINASWNARHAKNIYDAEDNMKNSEEDFPLFARKKSLQENYIHRNRGVFNIGIVFDI
jgi:hypothetical protein